jgi:hypothetical protein
LGTKYWGVPDKELGTKYRGAPDQELGTKCWGVSDNEATKAQELSKSSARAIGAHHYGWINRTGSRYHRRPTPRLAARSPRPDGPNQRRQGSVALHPTGVHRCYSRRSRWHPQQAPCIESHITNTWRVRALRLPAATPPSFTRDYRFPIQPEKTILLRIMSYRTALLDFLWICCVVDVWWQFALAICLAGKADRELAQAPKVHARASKGQCLPPKCDLTV